MNPTIIFVVAIFGLLFPIFTDFIFGLKSSRVGVKRLVMFFTVSIPMRVICSLPAIFFLSMLGQAFSSEGGNSSQVSFLTAVMHIMSGFFLQAFPILTALGLLSMYLGILARSFFKRETINQRSS